MRTKSISWQLRFAACLIVLTAGTSIGFAAGYDEASNGDLSDDNLAPTPLALAPGSNVVQGDYGNGDLDYLAMTVPAGHRLSRVILGSSTVFGGTRSFIAVQAGPVMTVPPTTSSASGLLGWTHFDVGQYGRDILPEIAIGPGSTQFTPPLSAGTYTFWIQETGLQPGLRFELDFQVTSAPQAHQVPVLPAAFSLLLASALALTGARVLKGSPTSNGTTRNAISDRTPVRIDG